MMRLLHRSLETVVAAAILHIGICTAGFTATTSFAAVSQGQPFTLSWDAVDPKNYPLYLTAQLIDRGASGQSVTGYKMNVSSKFVLT